MTSFKDKLLSSHRSNIQSTFGGHLNIFFSVLLFNVLDICILGYFWFLHFNAVKQFECKAFFIDVIVNTILTFTPLIALIKSSILFYTCKFAGLVAFHSLRLSRSNQKLLNNYYISRLGIYLNSVIFCIARLVLIILAVWYALVLEKIRFVGGTGFEKKPASDFEEQALEEYLKDKDPSLTLDLNKSHEFILEPTI
ncbi:uncharacterized protein TA13065 [Theileria annulata]|uniref:Uncharacterized protein n=1 Tax=Theileria annulata TaxID=5874 RepID=Q4UEC1_THEAN|nr:uncharacterized protein TA13065 [Theileria annulata]CAI74568.1 hypothetical protein TA13065 [Theileria annulata]|eukprot:XP_952300.1 hypothetical protein TA13065 [Theileria annulata]